VQGYQQIASGCSDESFLQDPVLWTISNNTVNNFHGHIDIATCPALANFV
jgi:hypothetical protein